MSAQPDKEKDQFGFQILGRGFPKVAVAPGLHIVATPIGNLGDMTIRALQVLSGCDMIACEDTRVTAKLLRHYAIKRPLQSYNEHNAERIGQQLLNELEQGKSIALVSDAGMPLISDPGFRLVRDARKMNLPVEVLPGATAPVTALAASGLSPTAWTFIGFTPHKKGARKALFETHRDRPETLVFFESPNRIAASLNDMAEVFGANRIACVARELTKLHEEVVAMPLNALAEKFSQTKTKGEIVVLVAGETKTEEMDAEGLLSDLLEKMSVSEAASEAAQLISRPKRELYKLALKIKDGS